MMRQNDHDPIRLGSVVSQHSDGLVVEMFIYHDAIGSRAKMWRVDRGERRGADGQMCLDDCTGFRSAVHFVGVETGV